MKRIIACIFALLMCVSVLAACSNDTPANSTAVSDLTAAKDYLYTMYKDATEATPADYTVVGVVMIGTNEFVVEWTSDSEFVKIVPGDNKMVTIDVDEANPEEVSYNLTATVTDAEGNSESVSFFHRTPAAIIIEEGMSYVLQSGAFDVGTDPTPDFVKGITKSNIITDENLLEFVYDGDQEDGEIVWILKQVSTGLYLENKTGIISYTDTKARAWRFIIKDAISYTSEQMDAESSEVESWACATLRTPNAQCGVGVVFCGADQTLESATRTNTTFLLNGALGGNPTLGNNYNQNMWYVYGVEEMPASTYIRNVLDEIVPAEGLDNLYNVGDEPGQISKALHDEMLDAYSNALTVANTEGVTYEMADAAIDRLKAAIRAAQDGAVKVKDGYYYFRSARTELNAT